MKLVTLLSFITLIGGTTCLKCIDEDGQDVDWSILYKLPQERKWSSSVENDIGVVEGLSYVYLTSKTSTKAGWTLSKHTIDDPASIPGRTLAPLYRSSSKVNGSAYVLYNDEHPDGKTSFTDGHTKGVVAFDREEGFWLVHSVPKYPPEIRVDAKYDYPPTGHRYAQSFLCISLPTATSADTIGRLLLYNQPYVYSSNVPVWAQKYLAFKAASEGHHVKNPPFFTMRSLKSLGGTGFTAFAKFSKFGKDLYADLVAPALKTGLLVQSWPNGPGKMNSSCNRPFHVLNIDELDFAGIVDDKMKEVDFTSKHDHAKWAVATNDRDGANDVVCIGDINRMETQKVRGGGTVCFANNKAWKTFTKTIKNVELCPSN